MAYVVWFHFDQKEAPGIEPDAFNYVISTVTKSTIIKIKLYIFYLVSYQISYGEAREAILDGMIQAAEG